MTTSAPLRRRWFRYSLRTLFVLVTVFCVWLGVQVKWIHDRREVVRLGTVDGIQIVAFDSGSPFASRVGISREPPFQSVGILTTGDGNRDLAAQRTLQSLFPEARIFIFYSPPPRSPYTPEEWEDIKEAAAEAEREANKN